MPLALLTTAGLDKHSVDTNKPHLLLKLIDIRIILTQFNYVDITNYWYLSTIHERTHVQGNDTTPYSLRSIQSLH